MRLAAARRIAGVLPRARNPLSTMPRVLLLLAFANPYVCAAPGEDPADALREADHAFCRETRAKGIEGWLTAGRTQELMAETGILQAQR